ncbi:MAG: HisA/HisF-related TIM barrel protein [Dehalococcoidia bacterium]
MAQLHAITPWLTLGGGRKGDPLELANPVIAAAGTFGAGAELQRLGEPARPGAIVSPAVARRTRRSVTGLQLLEVPAGLLLTGQYPTVSHRRVVEDLAPLWRTWRSPVIVNVLADDRDACLEVAAALADVDGVSALELSFAWPVVGSTAESWLPDVVAGLTGAIASVWSRPLIAKLPYGAGDGIALATAAVEGGADAVALGGGFPGQGVWAGRNTLGAVVGPCTKPLALRVVAAVAPSVTVPLIASGGITAAADAVDFLQAGARAVQVGSATIRDPRAVYRIAGDINTLLATHETGAQGDDRIRAVDDTIEGSRGE